MTKTNNKGFSLVELIIVIAIMAVLVGILAPQFVQYVERSRESTDIKNVQEMVTAMQVYAADPDGAPVVDGSTITLDGSAASDSSIDDALTNAGLAATYTASSTEYANTVITVTNTNGALTFAAQVSDTDTTSQNDDFGF